MTGPRVAQCWYDYNDLTGAIRILGELAITGFGSFAAAMMSLLLSAFLYDGITGGNMYCEARHLKCGVDALLVAGLPQLVVLFFAGVVFMFEPLSDLRAMLRKIVVRAVPIATILGTIFVVMGLAKMPPEDLAYAPWHSLGMALTTLGLLLIMTLWRRLWVRAR